LPDQRNRSKSPGDRPLIRAALLLMIVAAFLSLNLGPADQRIKNPHGAFQQECANCHSEEGWLPPLIPPEFDHDKVSAYTLRGAHRDLGCPVCHTSPVFSEAPGHCAGCHQDVHQGELGTDCDRCHGEESFVEHGSWLQQHATTRMPLIGRHLTADCEACHQPQPQGRLKWVGLPADCYACHRREYENTVDPDHLDSGFATGCEQCHTAGGWVPAFFSHNSSGFPLTGGHAGLDCGDCHTDGTYENTSSDCYACHGEDYENTTDPDHRAAGYSTDCTVCHSTNDWHGTTDHSGFPLTGGHNGLDCNDCHANGVYEGTPTDCYSCHQEDYSRQHTGSGYPTDCLECHSTSNWDAETTSHDSFPLTGGHNGLDCNDCHANGVYEGTPDDCWSCHADDYNGTSDPNHGAAGYAHDCRECHSTSDWDADNSHDSFPLTGGHNGLDCAACHTDGQYQGTPSDCWSCHADDYNGTNNPDHGAAGYSHDCLECHDTNDWDGATDHPGFPLTGGHGGLDCNACHANGQYEGTPTDCYACHSGDYDQEHTGSGFPHDCLECHTTSNWDADFDHGSWPLTGSHTMAACTDCHQNGQYEGTPTDCYACHRAEYEDEHDSSVPHDCSQCHTTSDWDAGDHSSFPLTGGHGGLDCSACHPNGQYEGTPTDCWSCHEDDYEDEHVGSGFPHDCTECHTTNDWDADFAHTSWALTGAHIMVSCDACHPDGTYQGTPTDCYDCHTQDFNKEHGGDGYPHDCTICHDTSDWDSDFNHSAVWPLTGAHRYTDCTECHIGGVWSGTPTLCYDCHREDYEDEHDSSTSHHCEECHSTSDWDDDSARATAPFHDAVFPIYSGRHRNLWFSCRECHPNKKNPAIFTCGGCHSPGDHPAAVLKKAGRSPSVFRSNDRSCLFCHPRGD